MLHTHLTTCWKLSYPIVGAPMAYVGKGRLARAVSEAGGLGMLGIGSKDSAAYIAREAQIARGDDQGRFGIGLLAWSLASRPEQLEAALAARPFLISISFGSLAPYAARIKQEGVLLASQVHSREEALAAVQDGADLLVAQGTEAGGHTGHVSTLPLLQSILDVVEVPIIAAGGIATPRGVAAALAAGAEGVWIGTCLLASPECDTTEDARSRIIAAQESETVLTRAFDVAQGFAWPPEYPGRALRNRFSEQWHERVDELAKDQEAQQQLREAVARKDYDLAQIYAGEAVGLVRQRLPAGEIVRRLGEGTEQLLRERYAALLGEA
ncbi:NAD(P)H-dependent flavin oxidoreductase [Ktedonobacter robiniae]|uniref:2-nitropropane dioxygenase n=1 Tax=Ktedonobacter robiniae TaxID=2778365 RepID=A0ABQ3V3T5_9CHLR|nr:nitronate monooxygenase [Ktedonobacter robiniae]GHO59831.1 2-nitropropane dioxygenase [Ktedonobacter robiniae]